MKGLLLVGRLNNYKKIVVYIPTIEGLFYYTSISIEKKLIVTRVLYVVMTEYKLLSAH